LSVTGSDAVGGLIVLQDDSEVVTLPTGISCAEGYIPSVTPAGKFSSFAVGDLNFVNEVDEEWSDEEWSEKCSYVGKLESDLTAERCVIAGSELDAILETLFPSESAKYEASWDAWCDASRINSLIIVILLPTLAFLYCCFRCEGHKACKDCFNRASDEMVNGREERERHRMILEMVGGSVPTVEDSVILSSRQVTHRRHVHGGAQGPAQGSITDSIRERDAMGTLTRILHHPAMHDGGLVGGLVGSIRNYSYPVTMVTRDGDSEENDCSICMEPLSETSRELINCGHRFHMDCIKKWVKGEHGYGATRTCPNCRTEVDVMGGGNDRL
jgi:hypothetical protein